VEKIVNFKQTYKVHGTVAEHPQEEFETLQDRQAKNQSFVLLALLIDQLPSAIRKYSKHSQRFWLNSW